MLFVVAALAALAAWSFLGLRVFSHVCEMLDCICNMFDYAARVSNSPSATEEGVFTEEAAAA